MKTFLLSSLGFLALTACVLPQPSEPTIVYAQPAPAAVEEAPTVRENPYALKKGPAYDDSKFVYEEKEKQLFRMESDLLNAQQELYDRERQLANREAEFLSKSKSLYQKEKMLNEREESLSRAVPAPAAPEKNYEPQPRPRPMVISAPVLRPLPEKKVNPYRNQSRPADIATDYNTSSPVIILEHPIQRDLVRCAVTDDTCLHSYERLGYIRSDELSDYSTPDEPAVQEAAGNPDLAWW